MQEWIITEELAGKRLDAALAGFLDKDSFSRSYIQDLIKDSQVDVSGKVITKASYKVKVSETIRMEVPEPQELSIEPEKLPVEIVFEDEHFMVVNKPINMVTHPAPGVYSGTLVNAVMYHVQQNETGLSAINGVMRPGIVHRLDKDTSGLMVVAKSDAAHKNLAEQIQSRNLERRYIALVEGYIKQDKGMITASIERHATQRHKMTTRSNAIKPRDALTNFVIKNRYEYANKRFTLVECKLDTGRTHQIRVHLSHIKHPILGDLTYGAKAKPGLKVERPMLHSYKLKLNHPIDGKELNFEIPFAVDFQEVFDKLSC